MSDPVADFIAREQDMLAELGDSPAVLGGVADPAPVAAPAAQYDALADEFAGLAAPADPVSMHNTDSGVDLSGLGDAAPPMPVLNGGGGLLNGEGSKGPSPVPMMPRIEAENIRKWREQQAILLEKKDENEEKKKKDLREQAKKELSDWYAQREGALKVAKEANRKAEAEHVAAFAKTQGEGAQWDEVAKLCGDQKTVKGGKDVSRLKSLLLHLKDHNKK